MKVYTSLIRLRFLTMLAYRLNYFSGILTYVIYVGAYFFLYRAMFSGGAANLGGFSPTQMTTYLVVSYMTRAFYFNNLDSEIMNEVEDGTVAISLIRPYSYPISKFFSGLGEGLFRLLFWMLPGMIVATLLFPVQLPTDPQHWALFIVSGLLAFAINAQINVTFGLLSFFLVKIRSLNWAKRLVTDLLSGVFLPLDLWPSAVRAVLNFLPFQAISYLPSAIFTGHLTGLAALQALGVQAVWVVLLAACTTWMWRRARRVLVVQGG